MNPSNGNGYNGNGNRAHGSLWGIVLAGGEGSRVRGFLKQLCGGRGIKQFCSIVGRRSMLEHTLARVERLIPPERILVIVNAHHRLEAAPQLRHWPRENLIYQPLNRDTGPGILLPLAHISFRDPLATVAVFPSDHFILEEEKFMTAVGQAAAETDRHPMDMVLLGMTPDRLEQGYGWIEPEDKGQGGETRAVRRFFEKPSASFARLLMTRGALWNTLVFTARASALWELARRAVPDLYQTFSLVRMMLASRHAPHYIEHVYERMPVVNFSSEVLGPLASSLRVLPVPEVGWSDWGSADRICASLKRMGKFEQLFDRLRFCNVDLDTQKLLAQFCARPPTKISAPVKNHRPDLRAAG
ncbi:MAG: sugar phosphate nucleotidyltransferase [Candidatus Binatia bacterium]